MTRSIPLRTSLLAILVFQVFALFLRAFLELELIQSGLQRNFAADLSYLVVPPVFIVLMWPILRDNKSSLLKALDPNRINLRLVLTAVAIGLLARITWWSQLTMRIAFGWTRNTDPDAITGPVFSYNCPSPQVMFVALLVFGCLIPVIEEVVNRGLIQTWLMPKGRWFAILVSAALFAVFHPPGSYLFVFIFGIVFAVQFANTQTLWATIITHATYDVLILFDWRCLQGSWNPSATSLPMTGFGLGSLAALVLLFVGIAYLIGRKGPAIG